MAIERGHDPNQPLNALEYPPFSAPIEGDPRTGSAYRRQANPAGEQRQEDDRQAAKEAALQRKLAARRDGAVPKPKPKPRSKPPPGKVSSRYDCLSTFFCCMRCFDAVVFVMIFVQQSSHPREAQQGCRVGGLSSTGVVFAFCGRR